MGCNAREEAEEDDKDGEDGDGQVDDVHLQARGELVRCSSRPGLLPLDDRLVGL